MGPHAEHVDDLVFGEDFIDQSMLDVDPAGVAAGQVADQLLEPRRCGEGIFGDDGEERLSAGLNRLGEGSADSRLIALAPRRVVRRKTPSGRLPSCLLSGYVGQTIRVTSRVEASRPRGPRQPSQGVAQEGLKEGCGAVARTTGPRIRARSLVRATLRPHNASRGEELDDSSSVISRLSNVITAIIGLAYIYR